MVCACVRGTTMRIGTLMHVTTELVFDASTILNSRVTWVPWKIHFIALATLTKLTMHSLRQKQVDEYEHVRIQVLVPG